MRERREVTVELPPLEYSDGDGVDELSIPLALVIERASAALNKVPPAFHGSARMIVNSHAGAFAYTRPETAEEMTEREKMEAAHSAEVENIERAHYERLKAKFG